MVSRLRRIGGRLGLGHQSTASDTRLGTRPGAITARAKAAFAGAWERFHAGLTPDDIAREHQFKDAAASPRPGQTNSLRAHQTNQVLRSIHGI